MKWKQSLVNPSLFMRFWDGVPQKLFSGLRPKIQNGKNQTEFYLLDERRRTYQIIMKNPKFAPLDGYIRQSMRSKEKIKSFALDDMMVNGTIPAEKVANQYVWKCPKCSAYGNSRQYTIDGTTRTLVQINRFPSSVYDIERCYNCGFDIKFPRSDWLALTPYPESGIIGIVEGGSLNVIKTLASLKIIR